MQYKSNRNPQRPESRKNCCALTSAYFEATQRRAGRAGMSCVA